MTNPAKPHKLETTRDAILCPFCCAAFRTLRLDRGARAENIRLRCHRCKREIAVCINGTSALWVSVDNSREF